MNYFTNGYELSTAITNLFISLFAFVSFFSIKKYKNKLWNSFFVTLVIDGLLGFIIHGIQMSQGTINFYWAILLIGFCFTINILLAIFINEMFSKNKVKLLSIILLSILLYILLLVELLIEIDFLITFIIYACICLLIILFESINLLIKKKPYSIYYIFAIIFQVIGGLFLIYKKGLFIFDKNGIYHIYMILTILFFYLGCARKLMLERH